MVSVPSSSACISTMLAAMSSGVPASAMIHNQSQEPAVGGQLNKCHTLGRPVRCGRERNASKQYLHHPPDPSLTQTRVGGPPYT
jgi:hypothetical protein